jgi:hypothetical protein
MTVLLALLFGWLCADTALVALERRYPPRPEVLFDSGERFPAWLWSRQEVFA